MCESYTSGFSPDLEKLEILNFVISFSRPGKLLEFAQKVGKPGILAQNLGKKV